VFFSSKALSFAISDVKETSLSLTFVVFTAKDAILSIIFAPKSTTFPPVFKREEGMLEASSAIVVEIPVVTGFLILPVID